MKTHVYISKPNRGWSEFNIPGEFQQLSYEKLVNRIHSLLSRSTYKGLLITQNPEPFSRESQVSGTRRLSLSKPGKVEKVEKV